MLTQIIQIYLSDVPSLLKKLDEGLAAGDASAVQKAAHTLKSSSANLGALQMADLCKTLEAGGREAALEKAPQLLTQIKTEFVRVEQGLTAEIGA